MLPAHGREVLKVQRFGKEQLKVEFCTCLVWKIFVAHVTGKRQ